MTDPIAAKLEEIIHLDRELENEAAESGAGVSKMDKIILTIGTKRDELALLQRQESQAFKGAGQRAGQ